MTEIRWVCNLIRLRTVCASTTFRPSATLYTMLSSPFLCFGLLRPPRRGHDERAVSNAAVLAVARHPQSAIPDDRLLPPCVVPNAPATTVEFYSTQIQTAIFEHTTETSRGHYSETTSEEPSPRQRGARNPGRAAQERLDHHQDTCQESMAKE